MRGDLLISILKNVLIFVQKIVSENCNFCITILPFINQPA